MTDLSRLRLKCTSEIFWNYDPWSASEDSLAWRFYVHPTLAELYTKQMDSCVSKAATSPFQGRSIPTISIGLFETQWAAKIENN